MIGLAVKPQLRLAEALKAEERRQEFRRFCDTSFPGLNTMMDEARRRFIDRQKRVAELSAGDLQKTLRKMTRERLVRISAKSD